MNNVQNTFLIQSRKPIQIKDKTFPCSYTNSEMNFLSQQYAQEQKVSFLNLADYFESIWTGNQTKHQQFLEQLNQQETLITSLLILPSLNTQEGRSIYWIPFFQDLAQCYSNKKKKKIVIPLNLNQENLPLAHLASLCVQLHPDKEEANLIFCEQHAQNPSNPDYDKSFDYRPILKEYSSVFTLALKQFTGVQNVHTVMNQQPISRFHNVCGVVASEVCRQMLASPNPIDLAQKMMITDSELPLLHKQNRTRHRNHIITNTFLKTSPQNI